MNDIRKHLYLYVLAVLALVFWHKLLIFKTTIFFGNIPSVFYPYIEFIKQSYRNLEFPLWNPCILGGIPLFANFSPTCRRAPFILSM